MKSRTFGAIILLAVLICSLIIGYELFAVVILLAALLGYREFMNVRFKDRNNNIETVRFFGYASVILLVWNNIFYTLDDKLTLIIPMLCLTIPIIFYNDNKKYNINDAMYIIGVILFVGFSFNNIIYMDKLDVHKCILIFILSFATDTYAYLGGNLVGKTKLTSISPKKTVEGSVIGVVMGVIIGSLYYYTFIGGMSLKFIILMCLVLSVLSEMGDLVFSSIKRYFNKKDYSNLIPGHGGVLDRFDSVIFVSLGLTVILSLL
ncbi:MAG: phosphatidate cytidylyltransferase [Bacilli bacterium]|nr:phosphatidate cytidylyltransferase [Bacilli bacterium]